MKVSFEEVEALHQRLVEINSVPFAQIEWTRGGQTVFVTAEEAEDWRFVGMSNASFVEFYDSEIAQ